jgi:hypothetical protein
MREIQHGKLTSRTSSKGVIVAILTLARRPLVLLYSYLLIMYLIFFQTWYPNSFSPSEDNSYSDASDGQRVVQLQSLANTGMEVIDKIDKRLKELEEKKREKLGRWGFLEDMDDTPYRISTNSHDLGKIQRNALQ